MRVGKRKGTGKPTTWRCIINGLMIVVMNVWVPMVMVLETLLSIMISPILFVIWRCVTDWPDSKIIRHFVYIYGRVWRWMVWPFVRVQGTGCGIEKFPSSCMMVANHLSFFDTYILAVLPIFDAAIYLRSWPFKRMVHTEPSS